MCNLIFTPQQSRGFFSALPLPNSLFFFSPSFRSPLIAQREALPLLLPRVSQPQCLERSLMVIPFLPLASHRSSLNERLCLSRFCSRGFSLGSLSHSALSVRSRSSLSSARLSSLIAQREAMPLPPPLHHRSLRFFAGPSHPPPFRLASPRSAVPSFSFFPSFFPFPLHFTKLFYNFVIF